MYYSHPIGWMKANMLPPRYRKEHMLCDLHHWATWKLRICYSHLYMSQQTGTIDGAAVNDWQDSACYPSHSDNIVLWMVLVCKYSEHEYNEQWTCPNKHTHNQSKYSRRASGTYNTLKKVKEKENPGVLIMQRVEIILQMRGGANGVTNNNWCPRSHL